MHDEETHQEPATRRSSTSVTILERVGPKFQYAFRHLGSDLGPPRPLGGGEKVHLQPLPAQADLVQQSLDIVDPPFGGGITFQVMTGAL